MKNKKTFVMIGFIFLLMIVNAVAENMRGVLVTVFKSEFAVKDTNIGVMLFIGSLGYVIATFVGGLLCEKIGQKKVLLSGIMFMIVSVGLVSKAGVFNDLLVGMFLMNVGLGLTSIAINTLIPVLLISFQAVLMNVTHFCYGVGASIGPKITGDMIQRGASWRTLYLYIGIGFVVLFFIFLFVKIPFAHKPCELKQTQDDHITNKGMILCYIIALGFYVSAEMGTGSWLINYIKNVYNYNEAVSATYLSIFFGALTVGRLLGGAVVERFGYINTIIKSLILAFGCYGIGLIMGEKGLILISFSGLFFSIVFPTTVLTISKVFNKKVSFITGSIVTASSAINMVMSVVIGRLNDSIGYKVTFYIMPVCLFISILFMIIIHAKTKHVLEGRSEE